MGLTLSATLAAAPSLAEDALPAGPPAQTASCTNAGQNYSVGQFACIAACHGQRRMARCDAVEAVAKWTYVSESCPSAMINPRWPSTWSEIPANVAMSPKPLVLDHSAPTFGLAIPKPARSLAMLD